MKIALVVSLGGLGLGIAFVIHSTLNGSRRQRRSHLHEGGNNSRRNAEPGSSNVGVKTNGQDFPAWLKALTRWNVSDTPRSTSASAQPFGGSPFDSFPFAIGGNKMNAGLLEVDMSPMVASLSGMVNVEALVAASNETDDEIDLLIPEMNELKRTIDTLEANRGVHGKGVGQNTSMKLFSFLDNALRWDDFAKNIQELTALIPDDSNVMNATFEEMVSMVPNNDPFYEELDENDQVVESSLRSNNAVTAEKILQDATQQLESLISATSSAFSPSAFQSLILRASNTLAIQDASGNLTAAAYGMAEYTAELVKFGNGVIVGGYSSLFRNYPSLRSIPVQEQRQKVIKAAEFATLSGAIYENTILNTHSVEHSIIAQGKTADILWMVTDSIQYERDFWPKSSEKNPTLVRTFILRGYDASDEEVDREGLLNVICTASPVSILKNEDTLVQVHEGMLSIAQELFRELESYIDMTSPSHKIVFTG